MTRKRRTETNAGGRARQPAPRRGRGLPRSLQQTAQSIAGRHLGFAEQITPPTDLAASGAGDFAEQFAHPAALAGAGAEDFAATLSQHVAPPTTPLMVDAATQANLSDDIAARYTSAALSPVVNGQAALARAHGLAGLLTHLGLFGGDEVEEEAGQEDRASEAEAPAYDTALAARSETPDTAQMAAQAQPSGTQSPLASPTEEGSAVMPSLLTATSVQPEQGPAAGGLRAQAFVDDLVAQSPVATPDRTQPLPVAVPPVREREQEGEEEGDNLLTHLEQAAEVAPYSALPETASLVSSIQRKSVDGAEAPATQQRTLAMREAADSIGRPLDGDTRDVMETVLGTDLSGVQVHTDDAADRAASSLSAQAFAAGRDIFFAQNNFDTATPSGMGLLGHELVHTLQQSEMPQRSPLSGGSATLEEPAAAEEQALSVERTLTHLLSQTAGDEGDEVPPGITGQPEALAGAPPAPLTASPAPPGVPRQMTPDAEQPAAPGMVFQPGNDLSAEIASRDENMRQVEEPERLMTSGIAGPLLAGQPALASGLGQQEDQAEQGSGAAGPSPGGVTSTRSPLPGIAPPAHSITRAISPAAMLGARAPAPAIESVEPAPQLPRATSLDLTPEALASRAAGLPLASEQAPETVAEPPWSEVAPTEPATSPPLGDAEPADRATAPSLMDAMPGLTSSPAPEDLSDSETVAIHEHFAGSASAAEADGLELHGPEPGDATITAAEPVASPLQGIGSNPVPLLSSLPGLQPIGQINQAAGRLPGLNNAETETEAGPASATIAQGQPEQPAPGLSLPFATGPAGLASGLLRGMSGTGPGATHDQTTSQITAGTGETPPAAVPQIMAPGAGGAESGLTVASPEAMGLLGVVGTALEATQPPGAESTSRGIEEGVPGGAANLLGATLPGAAADEAAPAPAPFPAMHGMELRAQGFSPISAEPVGLLGAVGPALSPTHPAEPGSVAMPAPGDVEAGTEAGATSQLPGAAQMAGLGLGATQVAQAIPDVAQGPGVTPVTTPMLGMSPDMAQTSGALPGAMGLAGHMMSRSQIGPTGGDTQGQGMAGMDGDVAPDGAGRQPGISLPMAGTGALGDTFDGAGMSQFPDLAGAPPGVAAIAGSPDGLHRLSSGLAGTIGLAALLGSRAGSIPQDGHPEGAAEDGIQQPPSSMPGLPIMGGMQPPSAFDGLFGAMHGFPSAAEAPEPPPPGVGLAPEPAPAPALAGALAHSALPALASHGTPQTGPAEPAPVADMPAGQHDDQGQEQPPMHIDDIVDQVMRRLRRQLALEHERAGGYLSHLLR